MTDTNLLRAKIAENGYQIQFIAKELELTRAGFNNKIKGKSEFYASEIYKLKELLNLSRSDVDNIFFYKKVDKK